MANAPPYGFGPGAGPAFRAAFSAPTGDPGAAGYGARDFPFRASRTGTYHYLCFMPGHTQMGMNGTLIVAGGSATR